MTQRRWSLVVGVALGAAIVCRVILSLALLDRPGLQYDETLFVNAATVRIPGMFIAHSVAGIPVMVFSYIGALKSWLYAPIFSLLGTSAAAVRAPVVVLVSGSLVLLYVGVRDLVNRPVAVLVVVVLAFDQSLFWYTRNDVGPSALEFALKCAAIALLARYRDQHRMRWLAALLLVLALGVFNKLNFIWVVNAAAVISTVAAIRHRASLRAWRRPALTWFAGLALIYVAFGAYYVGADIGSQGASAVVGSLALSWSRFTHGTASMLSGTSFYEYALGRVGDHELVAAVLLAMFCLGAVASIVRRQGRSLAVAGSATATALIALQCLFTYQARSGWHYIAIHPFFAIVAAYGAYVIAASVTRDRRRVAVPMVLLGVAAIVYDTLLFARYERALTHEPRVSSWSPSIYALSRYLEHQRGTIFTTDWGFVNPLLTLAPSRRYREETFLMWLPSRTAVPGLRRVVAQTPGPKLLLTHAPGRLVFKQTRVNLLRAGGAHLSLVKSMNGEDGRPLYEIYSWTG